MAVVIDITPRQLLNVSLTFKPATEVVQQVVLDGDSNQLLDGDGNPVSGWIEE